MNADFRDVLTALLRGRARFLVVGAHAVGVHGVPRATGDLDLWVEPTAENARRAYAALAEFGAPLGDLAVEDLARPGTVFQIGVPPRRIDVLTSIEGVTFGEAWPNRIEVPIDGLRVPVIGREELIRNKRALGRPRDLGDAEAIERARPAPGA